MDHLLVPLDGSKTSESVLPHVHRLIRSGASRVTLFRAEPPVAVGAPMGVIQTVLDST